jgi:hypothetical protein
MTQAARRSLRRARPRAARALDQNPAERQQELLDSHPQPTRQAGLDLARPGRHGIEQSREKARLILARVRDGLPAFEPKADSFGKVTADWLTRHVKAKGLRSKGEVTRLLNAHVPPAWKDREFTLIRKSDVAALLD